MLSQGDMRKLRILCGRFRQAIEACSRELVSPTLHRFPYGSCGDASDLLGHFLIERGFTPFDYMCGFLPESHKLVRDRAPSNRDWSHAWIAKSRLVIDITADQFPEVEKKVVVEYCSPWHHALKGKRKGIADYLKYDERVRSMLHSDYRAIVGRL